MHRRTVRMMLQAETCPERAAPSKRQSRIDRHMNYLSRRWAEGCHNSAQLHREIRSQGYRGSGSSVRHFVARKCDAPIRRPPHILRQMLGRAHFRMPKSAPPRRELLRAAHSIRASFTLMRSANPIPGDLWPVLRQNSIHLHFQQLNC